MQLYVDLTVPHLGADIIVWPESAVPALEENIRPFLGQVAAAAQSRGSSLVMGLIRRDAATGAHYNSIAGWTRGRPDPAVVRQAPAGALRRVLPGARPGARVAAAHEPAVFGLRAGPRRPGAVACGGRSRWRPRSATRTPTARSSCGSCGSRRCSSTSPTTPGSAIRRPRTSTSTSVACVRWKAAAPMLRATNDGVTALIAYDGSVTGSLPQFEPGVLRGDGAAPCGPDALRAFRQRARAGAAGRRPRRRRRGLAASPARRRMNEQHGALTSEGELYPSPPRALEYLDVGPPAAGRAIALGAGLLWARMPLPMELNHINVWLLADGDGWTLVDTGHGARCIPRGLAGPRTAGTRRPSAAPDRRHARSPGPHGPLALAARAPRCARVDVGDRASLDAASTSPPRTTTCWRANHAFLTAHGMDIDLDGLRRLSRHRARQVVRRTAAARAADAGWRLRSKWTGAPGR